MENIKLMVNRTDNYYTLNLNSKNNIGIETINLNIISVENFENEYEMIYVEIMVNHFYKTQEVGAYKNVIYINQSGIDDMEESNIEIRLSLISLSQDNINNVFIRVKKYF